MSEEKKGFEYYLSKSVSYLFHPLLAPLAGVFIINYYFGDICHLTEDGKTYIWAITTISTLILPLAFVPMMMYQKVIQSIEMKTAKERVTPLFIISVFYFFCWFIMYRLQAPQVYKVYLLVASFSVFGALILNFFTKVSTHMTGLGGLTASVYCLMYYSDSNLQLVFIILMGISGITAYARLRLNAHTPIQVYLGYIMGAGVAVFLFYLMQNSMDLI